MGAEAVDALEHRLEREHRGVGAERRVRGRDRRLAAPAAEPEHDRLELAAPVGQLVHLRGGRGRELVAPDDAALLKLAQALREHVGADVRQAGAQVGEALRAEQQLAHDEQRPALADEVERAGDSAAVAVGPHELSLSNQLANWIFQLDRVRWSHERTQRICTRRPLLGRHLAASQVTARRLLHRAVRLGGRARRVLAVPAARPRRRRHRGAGGARGVDDVRLGRRRGRDRRRRRRRAARWSRSRSTASTAAGSRSPPILRARRSGSGSSASTAAPSWSTSPARGR